MSASAPAVPDRLDRIGALLDETVGAGGIPGAVAAVGRGPDTLGRWVTGQADAVAGRPMRADTVFDLASLTKVVATTTVTLTLVGRGELALGDPVAGYLPDATACRDGGVTVAHLLTHTSGLPGSRRFYRWCRSGADLLRDLGQTALGQPPGTGVAYSDPGFMLLGEVVAVVAGEPLDAAVRRLVTGPLGLTATGFRPNGPAARFAATERRGDGTAWTGIVHDENARLMGGVAGDAGLFAPADDLARFAAWWVSDDDAVVPAALRRAAATCQTEGLGGRRGYGWACSGDAFDILGARWPPTAVSHTGFTGTSLALDPASGLWVVLLTNAVHAGRDATAVQALRRAVHEAAGSTWPHRPDLDLAEPGDRMRRGHLDGLFQAVALEHVVPADDLLGLGERPVADQDLTVAHQHRLGFLGGPQPVAVQSDAAGDHVVEPGKAPMLSASPFSAVSAASSSAKRVGSTQTSIMNFMSSPILVDMLHHHDEREPREGQPGGLAPRSSRRDGHHRQAMSLRDQGEQPRRRSRPAAPRRRVVLAHRSSPAVCRAGSSAWRTRSASGWPVAGCPFRRRTKRRKRSRRSRPWSCCPASPSPAACLRWAAPATVAVP